MIDMRRPARASGPSGAVRAGGAAGGPAGEVPASAELEVLYRHASFGFAVFDAQLRFVRINDWLAALNGLPAEAHLGRRLQELLPGLAGAAQAALRHVMQTGTPLRDVAFSGETPAAPGVVRHWVEQWFPIRDGHGDVVAAGVIVEETTALRRLAGETRRFAGALASSEARHEFLVRLHDQMRLIPDPDELAYRACALLGEHLHLDRAGFAEFDRDDGSVVVRRHYVDGVGSGEGRHRPDAFGETFLASLRAGRTLVEPDVRTSATLGEAGRRAHERWLTGAFVVVPVFERGRLAAMCFATSRFVRDWTLEEVRLVEAVAERAYDAMQRARAARRLEDSERQLQLAKAASGVCVYDVDLVEGTERLDAGLRALWGLAPDAPLTGEALRARVPSEDLARMDAARDAALAAGTDATFSVEHRVRRADDGRERHVLKTGVVIFRDGVPVRNVGTVQDVTARHEAERALREADRHKDEFLAMLAHELRTPLAPLRNALRYLEHCGVPEQGHGPLRIAARQVRHMTRLVEDLVELAGVRRGLLRLRPERLEVQRVLSAVVESLATTLEERSQRLSLELPEAPLRVDADPTRLAQVVGNLLTNASKYSDAGGTITLRAGHRDGEVFVEVRDEGVGIDRENLSRVFELFAQVDATVDRACGGLGIGLALVKRLVEAQGGRVAAASDGRGRGSTFTVRLPAAPERASAAAPPERAGEPLAGPMPAG